MTFDELVIFYITLIGCTAKELTIESGLANGTISRYIHAQRKPTSNSTTVPMIADGIVSLAKKQNIILDRDEIIQSMFIACETDESLDHALYRKNLRKLIDYMDLSLINIGSALNYDPSYISRVLAGHRHPYNLEELKINTAKFFAKYSSHQEDIICRLAELYGCTPFEAGTDNKMAEQTYTWLSTDHGTLHSSTPIGGILDTINEFDMEAFKDYLHIDSINLPTLNNNRIIDKRYKNFSSLKSAELDFIRNIEMTSKTGTTLMYCDMPLDIQACDPSFVKNWTFGIYTLIARGIKIRMIHDVYRPVDEIIAELQMYIPLHMTGEVYPYCLRKKSNTSLLHILHVSDTTALSGDAKDIYGKDSNFHVTSNPDDVLVYQKQANILINKSKPLVRVYSKNNMNKYISFIKKCPTVVTSSILYSTIPIFMFSEELLKTVIGRYDLPNEDVELILKYRDRYLFEITQLSNNCSINIIVPQIAKQPKSTKVLHLILADIFIDTEITLTYEEYVRLIKDCECFSEQYSNINLIYDKKPFFDDISVVVIENKLAVISKRANPVIHFVTDHEEIVNSTYNLFNS